MNTIEELKNYFLKEKNNPEFDITLLKGVILDRADTLNFNEEEVALIEIHLEK